VAAYRFLTTWVLDAPRKAAWDVLEDAERWPAWWRGVERVTVLERGGAGREGSQYRIAWRSRIPYELEFDFTVRRSQPPLLMEGEAVGALSGSGCWRLFEQDGVTAVLYDWDVRTTKPWMNLISPLARPAFAYNHDVVMRWGGEGLARELGASLLAAG
jgi:hypothetical protein